MSPASGSINPDGSYSLSDVIVGARRLNVFATGYEPASVPVTVVAGQPLTQNVAVDPLQISGPVFMPPSSFPCDGSADVTDLLNTWIADVPDNSTIQFRSGCTYRIDRTVLVPDRIGLTFSFQGASLVAGPEPAGLTPSQIRALSLVRITGGSGIRFTDSPVLVGRNPNGGTGLHAQDVTREAQHGLWLAGTSNFRIDAPAITDVFGDFIYMGPDLRSGTTWCDTVEVYDGEMTRNGRQGISIVAARHVTIRGNHLHEIRHAVFDMEPTVADWGAQDVLIESNRTGPARLLWFASLGAGWNISDITLLTNTMEAVTGTPVVDMLAPDGGQRGPGIHIIGNVFLVGGSPQPGFRFRNVRGIELTNNVCTFPTERHMTAVGLDNAQDVTLSGNQFCGAAELVALLNGAAYTDGGGNVLVC